MVRLGSRLRSRTDLGVSPGSSTDQLCSSGPLTKPLRALISSLASVPAPLGLLGHSCHC